MESESEQIKRSSTRKFAGSKPQEFYSEAYFLRAEGSNYGRKDAKGNTLFYPYDESQLTRDRNLSFWYSMVPGACFRSTFGLGHVHASRVCLPESSCSSKPPARTSEFSRFQLASPKKGGRLVWILVVSIFVVSGRVILRRQRLLQRQPRFRCMRPSGLHYLAKQRLMQLS